MKLNFGRRLLLILHWLMSLIACALAVLLCVWPEGISHLFNLFYGWIGKLQTDIIGAVFLGVYVLLTVVTAAIIFSGNRKGERGFITVDSSESGRTRIAVGAVEQMIRQAARGVDGISEMKSSITNHEDAISIQISVALQNGAHLPAVTMNLQRAIRSYIELNCGVSVQQVCVSVHSLEDGEENNNKHSWRKSAQTPVAQPELEPQKEEIQELNPVEVVGDAQTQSAESDDANLLSQTMAEAVEAEDMTAVDAQAETESEEEMK